MAPYFWKCENRVPIFTWLEIWKSRHTCSHLWGRKCESLPQSHQICENANPSFFFFFFSTPFHARIKSNSGVLVTHVENENVLNQIPGSYPIEPENEASMVSNRVAHGYQPRWGEFLGRLASSLQSSHRQNDASKVSVYEICRSASSRCFYVILRWDHVTIYYVQLLVRCKWRGSNLIEPKRKLLTVELLF